MNEKFKNMIKEAFELDQSFEIGLNDEFRHYENWDSLTKLSSDLHLLMNHIIW